MTLKFASATIKIVSFIDFDLIRKNTYKSRYFYRTVQNIKILNENYRESGLKTNV